MMDVWTKKAPDGNTIIFKREGSSDAGFVYLAEGRTTKETFTMQEELTREQVEQHFADYVTGSKPHIVTVRIMCPHCKKVLELEAAAKQGELGDYDISCPDCEKPFMIKLPGEIVSGPRLVTV